MQLESSEARDENHDAREYEATQAVSETKAIFIPTFHHWMHALQFIISLLFQIGVMVHLLCEHNWRDIACNVEVLVTIFTLLFRPWAASGFIYVSID